MIAIRKKYLLVVELVADLTQNADPVVIFLMNRYYFIKIIEDYPYQTHQIKVFQCKSFSKKGHIANSMNPKYSKLKNITRPQYPDLPPMSIEDRAAQFSPFAAVVGYDDAVEETARYTDSMIELSEDEIVLLNDALARLRESIDEKPQIRVTYFMPDAKKDGGEYVSKTGIVKRIDEYENVLIFTDGDKVAVSSIIKVEFVDTENADG